jgi:DNA-binding CsgD family transcriptional regulator
MDLDGGVRPITVALGQFGVLISRGLVEILSGDKSLRLIDMDSIETAVERGVAPDTPRVAILDESAVADGTVLEFMRCARPSIGLVVLTHRRGQASCVRLLVSGAIYLSMDACATDIIAAIHLAAGEPHDLGGMASLTARETEVLELLRLDQSYAEIARALSVGVETVRTHAAGVRRKLGVRSKRELSGLQWPLAIHLPHSR